ncbi:Hypothetical predicted protein [Olea europaea subsp. europaea]|uniref:Uncharacterized protein n=1 Tax=Olea europaea subsp. europaea TaxID=158383 RepID=A0A8S0RPN8_OLEEU|nr:Hypothetical predicted protein [Olea europaea subsp. europaea]
MGSAEPAAIEREGPVRSAWRGGIGEKNCFSGERGIDSNRGGTGPAIVGSAEPAAIEIEGPVRSAWRGGIGEKNCFSGEKVAPVSNCGPSIFDVNPAQGSMATVEGPGQGLWGPRSPPRSKRWPSEERLEGRDSGKKLLQRREGAGMVVPVSNCGPCVFDVNPAQGLIATVEGPGQRLWDPWSSPRSKARGQRGALRGAGWGNKLLHQRERERSQPRRDQASNCGVRGAHGDRKRGASGERLEGRDWGKNCFSGEKSSVGSDSNRGGTGPAIVGSVEPAAIESEGPAGSAWRGEIAEKNCFSDEKAQGAIAIAEGPGQRLWGPRSRRRSKARGQRGEQPRRDWANDCGVRGAGGDRKRGASRVRLERRDRGKNCFSGEKGSDSNRGGTGPAIVGSVEPAAIESEGPAGSAWRGGIAEKNCFSDEKVQRRERSQPRRDRASDCGVRGARRDRKRGASEGRLDGRDGGKNCFSCEKGKKKILYKRRKWGNTRTSQGVTHPSTTLAQARLTSEF